ncbi:MAG: PepSY domain-containing protein [Pseudomonadota bacterium]
MFEGLTRRALAASLIATTIAAALPFASTHAGHAQSGQARWGDRQASPITSQLPLVEWRGRDVRLAGVSLDQAVAMAERRFNAKVVRAGVAESNGRRVYVLRLLSEQGRVWTVRVDADSGTVM